MFAAMAIARPSPSLALIAAATSRHGSTWRPLDNGAADAARRAGNSRFPGEVKERHGAALSIALYLFCSRAYSHCGKPAKRRGCAMTAVNSVTDLSRAGEIAVVAINSPPVNALSADVRNELRDGVAKAAADPEVKAIVVICAGRTFIAGADIAEFGKPPKGATLPELQGVLEGG